MNTMNKSLFYAAALLALVSCSDSNYVGDNNPMGNDYGGEIAFGLKMQNPTRDASELIGSAAAEKLGGMFVVEGTKGAEQTNSPSTTVVFDNYLVGYTANTAGVTESNTHNWEYVGLQTGITGRMTAETWSALHSGATDAKSQTVKYWDYSAAQYDFIAWSTGGLEAVTDDPASNTSVKVTRINTGNTLATNGFTLTAADANDLSKCYFTDINTIKKGTNGDNYGKVVTLTFKSMAAKVRIALYETVPGYSVKDVKFYTSDANPTAPTDLGTGTSTAANLFTMGADVLPTGGSVTVCYPIIGSTQAAVAGYNKASVTAVPGAATAATQGFGTLSNFAAAELHETAGTNYLGRALPNATYAGDATNNYYTAVIPNPNGKPLTLRVDYTLISTDGSNEVINIYGAKAVVPATYTKWLPNYAYTYIFKIADNTNGWTSQTSTDPNGLFPITFDAVVTSYIDSNAEQTTVTTVATPSITTYQQGHDHANKDEYSKSQKAGADQTNVKDLYVQVMDNSGATPTLKDDLNSAGKSLLFSVSKATASEAEVMDALQNRTNSYSVASPVGRNGITLTTNTNISNSETSIVNGVDDKPIAVASGSAAMIDIDLLTVGTYAYVYCTTVPTAEEKVYHVAAATSENYANYYEVATTDISATPLAAESKAEAGKVYFVKNVDGSFTFKQTKVGEDVAGLYEATIPAAKATTYTATKFYFDVYNQNNGAYAVKVIKVVE